MTDVPGMPNPSDQDELVPMVKKRQGMKAQGIKPHTRLDRKNVGTLSGLKRAAGLKLGKG